MAQSASSGARNPDEWKLAMVKIAHTLIYLVMASSTLFVVYSGISGYVGRWLIVPLFLVTIEGVVFFANGMACPFTRLAQKYGAKKGWAFNTFLPERATRYTFRFFGTLLAIGVLLLALRALGVIESDSLLR